MGLLWGDSNLGARDTKVAKSKIGAGSVQPYSLVGEVTLMNYWHTQVLTPKKRETNKNLIALKEILIL